MGNSAAAVAETIERRQFLARYSDKLSKITLIAIVVAAISVMTSCVLAVMLVNRERVYFGISETGGVLPMIPLSSPGISKTGMIQFAADAVRRCFTVNFHEHAEQRMECSKSFTASGFDAFNAEMTRPGGFVSTVINERLVTSGIASEAPVIKEEGVRNGVAYWVVQAPFIITYISPSDRKTQAVVVSVTVMRRSITEHPLGIGISQMISVDTSLQR